jgi:MFS family permease
VPDGTEHMEPAGPDAAAAQRPGTAALRPGPVPGVAPSSEAGSAGLAGSAATAENAAAAEAPGNGVSPGPGTGPGTGIRPQAGPAGEPSPAGEPAPKGGLFSNRPFRLLFSAAAVSMLGTQVSLLALPLVAVITLNASPAQVGLLGALGTLAFLLIGLPAGAWLDRVRRHKVMVAADLVRMVLIGSVPVAWALHVLAMPQLYAVVFLSGIATVFFDVSSQSYLPAIVPQERLVEANSRLSSWDALNSVAGPSLAGYLVQLITAPAAAIVDAASYLWSALCLARIRQPEPKPERSGSSRHLIRDIKEGVAFVFRHPLLRPIAINGTATNFFIQIAIVILPLMFRRVLGFSAFTLGFFFAVDGVGMLLGALSARRLTAWLGEGRALWIMGIAVTPACVVFPMVNHGPWLWIAAVAWLVLNFRISVNNVVLISFRQRVTPHRMLGRMNATMRFLMTGVLSLSGLTAGLIGQFVSVRAALWVASVGLAVVWLPLFFSPMRTMTKLPTGQFPAS